MGIEAGVTRWRLRHCIAGCDGCGVRGVAGWIGVRGPDAGRALCCWCHYERVSEEGAAAQPKEEP